MPPRAASAAPSSAEIGLGEDDAVGHRDLLHGLLMRVEGRGAVHRIDDGDDAVKGVAQREIRMIEHRVQDRRRIGEARRLDDDALERRDAAVVALAQEILERRDEVAAHGAAEASGGEQDHGVVDGLDKQMIEADLAELVDDDDRVGESRILAAAG